MKNVSPDKISMNSKDFNKLTELPLENATTEQLEMLYTRYHFASGFCKGRILEVGCGSGIGLSYLAKKAKKVFGCDIDKRNLSIAKKQEAKNRKVKVFFADAKNIPLESNSLDTIILFEAIYYLSAPEKFLEEARRLLKKNGVLVICTANKEVSGFCRSPLSHKYFSSKELAKLLEEKKFSVKLFGGFQEKPKTLKERTVFALKRTAIKLNLIPGTVKSRTLLKRIFLGKLEKIPESIEDRMAAYIKPKEISKKTTDAEHKVLYAVAIKK